MITKIILTAIILSLLVFIWKQRKKGKQDRLFSKWYIEQAQQKIADKLTENNNWFDEKKAERDKKYMEAQLKLKLDQENDLRKLAEEMQEDLNNV